MSATHRRYDDKTGNWVECDGRIIDVGTLMVPNKKLCVKCRHSYIGIGLDGESGEVVEIFANDDVESPPIRTAQPTLWQKLLDWLW